MADGMGRFTGAAAGATEGVETTELIEDFLAVLFPGLFFSVLLADASSAPSLLTGFVLASGFKAFFFFSTRATASASHAAFNRPFPPGRLFHSADPELPATSSNVFP